MAQTDATVMATLNHTARSPRISVGAISTMDIVPVTVSEPIPRPDITRDTYNPANVGVKVAIICPMAQTMT